MHYVNYTTLLIISALPHIIIGLSCSLELMNPFKNDVDKRSITYEQMQVRGSYGSMNHSFALHSSEGSELSGIAIPQTLLLA